MNVLPYVETIKYLLLENVAGFETSKARDDVIDSLTSSGFETQEFLICPRQIGIPNSRMRYYLLAKKGEHINWSFTKSNCLIRSFENLSGNMEIMSMTIDSHKISEYFDHESDTVGFDNLEVPAQVLSKHGKILDIVRSDSIVSCCFTAGYFRYCEGTGSVIQTEGTEADLHSTYSMLQSHGPDILSNLKLRYFSPREVSKLLGFPATFSFPSSTTLRQQYKSLGNSLNVTVVGLLIFSLLK